MERVVSFDIKQDHYSGPIEVVAQYANPFRREQSSSYVSVSEIYNQKTFDRVSERLLQDQNDMHLYCVNAKKSLKSSAQGCGAFTALAVIFGGVAYHYDYKIKHLSSSAASVSSDPQKQDKKEVLPESSKKVRPVPASPAKKPGHALVVPPASGQGQKSVSAHPKEKTEEGVKVPSEQHVFSNNMMLYGSGILSGLFACIALGLVAGIACDYNRFTKADYNFKRIFRARKQLAKTFKDRQDNRLEHNLSRVMTDRESCSQPQKGKHHTL